MRCFHQAFRLLRKKQVVEIFKDFLPTLTGFRCKRREEYRVFRKQSDYDVSVVCSKGIKKFFNLFHNINIYRAET